MELLPDSEDKNVKKEEKSIERFMNELPEMNRRIAELEKLETEHKLRMEILQASENKYRELAEKYRADDKRIIESGKTEYIEEKYIQNGQEVIVQTAKTPLKDEKGNTIGILGIFWDITERRQIEEALKESEERYRTIIEYSNDMIWTLDTEGRFLFFNKRSEEMTGYKLENWKGKSFAPLIEKDDLTKVIEVFHKTLCGEPQQYEVSVKREDGSNIILFVNTAPIYSKGEVVGNVSFGRDVTERKKAEEQIKESLKQKLKKSNKQKKLLCYLIEGTRGGKTRALILRHLTEKSYNAHQKVFIR